MKNSLTVLLFTCNSIRHLDECLASLGSLKKNVLAIDLESRDGTVAYLKRQGIAVLTHPFVSYVEPAREFGLKSADSEWVFILDDDERMTPELIGEINKTIADPRGCTHFKVKRKEIFARRKWLKHGGWWPNYQLRLIHLPSFKLWPQSIHSTPQIEGEEGLLAEFLLHHSQNDWSEIVNKTIRFEGAESDLLLAAGKNVSTLIFFRKFLGELYRRLIRRKGFLDGGVGIMESIYQAYSKTITYLFLYEKKKKSGSL